MQQVDSAHTILAPGDANGAVPVKPARKRKSTGITPVTQSDPGQAAINAVLVMIQRAADKGEIETLERLLAWRDKQIAEAREMAFNEARSAAMSRMKAIHVDSENSQTHSRYASLAAMDEAVRTIYTDHGFSLSFDTEDTDKPEVVRLVCDVSHEGGHTRQYHINMPADGKGPRGNDVMTRTHATGSAITYGRRYLLAMIFNLTVKQDDDGNAAGRKPPAPSVTQVNRQTPNFADLKRTAAPRPPTVIDSPKRILEAEQQTPKFDALLTEAFPSSHGTVCQPRRGPVAVAREEIQTQARAAARQGRDVLNAFCRPMKKAVFADAVEPIRSELEALVKHVEASREWPKQPAPTLAPGDPGDIPDCLDRRTRQ